MYVRKANRASVQHGQFVFPISNALTAEKVNYQNGCSKPPLFTSILFMTQYILFYKFGELKASSKFVINLNFKLLEIRGSVMDDNYFVVKFYGIHN